jgi:hypothetical protein
MAIAIAYPFCLCVKATLSRELINSARWSVPRADRLPPQSQRRRRFVED